MVFDPQKHNRQSTRLKGYDYSSPGLYFVTICTYNRQCIFGKIMQEKMILNEWGQIACEEWQNTESIRDNVILDTFVIMPNHIHGIIGIDDSDGNVGSYNVGAYGDTPLHRHTPLHHNIDPEQSSEFKSPSKTLGAIVRGYKSAATTQINKECKNQGQKIWQRNYHDHIIRDEKSLNRIRYYIIHNPDQWEDDQNNPTNF